MVNIPKFFKDEGAMETKMLLPLLPLRDLVVLPHMVAPLFVGRTKSVNALADAMNKNKLVFLSTQKSANVDNPGESDINSIGTIGKVLQLLRLPDGTVKALVEGKSRARIERFSIQEDFFQVEVEKIIEPVVNESEALALVRSVIKEFEQYASINKNISKELVTNASAIVDTSQLADTVASHFSFKIEDKQKLLEIVSPAERLALLLSLIKMEIEVFQMDQRIKSRVKEQMEQTQKNYYLNEQMRAIKKEMGSEDEGGDELKDLACLGFSADLVMQSFCHTAAYPKPVDVDTHHTLPDFIMNRGGVSLRPGDGIIHSWLNRMLLPDTVGTGGDSHTRFPLGISFPAGSGLVAFAAATGVMPLDMPESVLVRFKGEMQPGITLRDLVHAIPYYAIQKGLLTVEKKGKKNVYNGRILEIEGLENLTVEQAFELSDASAERSAGGCTITLSEESVREYLESNIVMLKWMLSEGYGDERTISRRIEAMAEWLANPSLMRADPDAEYAEIIEIDLNEIREPILCAPNDPDDARLLSDVAGDQVDEVFIGSCMTNIGHFRAAGKLLEQYGKELPTRLWIAPPTRMDQAQLTEEGYYNIFGRMGARIETPGCSLCMGNQARIKENSTAVSTSTRNFPNRLGTGANVYLASAELAAVAAILGKLPTVEEYMAYANNIDTMASEVYRYLNFHRMEHYQQAAANVVIPVSEIASAS